MSTCTQDGCQGGHYKFDDCLTEAIWQDSLEGHPNAECGDADLYGTYYVLMVYPQATNVPLSDGPTVTVPEGGYILVTWSTGRVDLWRYNADTGSNADAAREEYDAQAKAYYTWVDSTDVEVDDDDEFGPEMCGTCGKEYPTVCQCGTISDD